MFAQGLAHHHQPEQIQAGMAGYGELLEIGEWQGPVKHSLTQVPLASECLLRSGLRTLAQPRTLRILVRRFPSVQVAVQRDAAPRETGYN